MSRFTEELTITQLSGKAGAWRRWRMHDALVYEVGDKGSGRLVVVPVGFVSDGPSIPRIFWNVLPVWGSWGRAGVIHDYLCARIAFGKPHREAKTRMDADLIFDEAMSALGVGIFSRAILFFGVRMGALMRVRTRSIDYNADLMRTDSED